MTIVENIPQVLLLFLTVLVQFVKSFTPQKRVRIAVYHYWSLVSVHQESHEPNCFYFDRARTGNYTTNMASRELRKKRGAVTPSPARKTVQKESERHFQHL